MELTPYQIDVLQELINIGVGKAASMLNSMVDTHIRLQVPELRVLTFADLLAHYNSQDNDTYATVQLSFSGEFSGSSALIFSPDSAAKLVSIIIGQEELPLDMDSLRIGTLQEVGNILLNGVIGSLANILEEHLMYSPLDYFEGDLSNMLRESKGEGQSTVLLVRTSFDLEAHSIGGDIVIFFQLGTFDSLIAAINRIAPGAGQMS